MSRASRRKEERGQPLLTRPLPVLVLVSLLALLVNFNVLSNGFGWDDKDIIKTLRLPEHWWSLLLPNSTRDPATKQDAAYFRPVVSVSYLLDKAIWRDDPFGFHLSVLMAHLLNTVMVFLLARSVMTVHRGWVEASAFSGHHAQPLTHHFFPLLVASLFAVHPVHAEAVAWIAGRNDVFCTTFLLASVLCYLRFHQTRQGLLFGLAMLSFFLAVLTKEMAVGLILLFPLMDYLLEPHPPSRLVQRVGLRVVIPTLILCLYFYLRHITITLPYGGASGSVILSSTALLKILAATGLYLKLMIFPYPHNPFMVALPSSPIALILSGLASALLLGGTLFALYRRHVVVGIGLTWTIILLAPGIMVAVLLDKAVAPAAERYVYAPSIGFLMVLVWLVGRGIERLWGVRGWAPRRGWITAGLLGIALVTVGGVESRNRNAVWRTPQTFWEAAVAQLPGKAPREALAHNNLGDTYSDQGRLEEAIREYQRALQLQPDYAEAHNNLANAYKSLGRLEEAIREYQTALKLQPRYIQIHTNLGTAYRDQGHLEEAIREYQTALQLQPDDADVHNDLGIAFSYQGRHEEAIREYRTALKLQPNFAKAHNNSANAYKSLGRLEEAIREYQAALRLQPNLAEAHNNLGLAYKDQGRLEEAIREYQRALQLQPDYAEAHNNLGAAYKGQGRLEEAIREYQTVLQLQPDHAKAHYNLGLAYRSMGMLQAARSEFEQALKIKPDFLPARQALEALPR